MSLGSENLVKARYLYESMEKNKYRGPQHGEAQQTTAACARHQRDGDIVSTECQSILMRDNGGKPFGNPRPIKAIETPNAGEIEVKAIKPKLL